MFLNHENITRNLQKGESRHFYLNYTERTGETRSHIALLWPQEGEKICMLEELNGLSKALDASHEAFQSFMVVQITYFWPKKI
jgi:hypothetical protein